MYAFFPSLSLMCGIVCVLCFVGGGSAPAGVRPHSDRPQQVAQRLSSGGGEAHISAELIETCRAELSCDWQELIFTFFLSVSSLSFWFLKSFLSHSVSPSVLLSSPVSRFYMMCYVRDNGRQGDQFDGDDGKVEAKNLCGVGLPPPSHYFLNWSPRRLLSGLSPIV